MRAKYYIYRNLHKDCFSIRLRGRVIAHETNLECFNAILQVSEKGRSMVQETRQKNVHAYVVCEDYRVIDDTQSIDLTGKVSVTYNPYLHDSFVEKITQEPVKSVDSALLLESKFIFV